MLFCYFINISSSCRHRRQCHCCNHSCSSSSGSSSNSSIIISTELLAQCDGGAWAGAGAGCGWVA